MGAKRSSSIRGSASFRKTSAQLLSRRLAFFGVTRNWDCQRLSCGSRIRNILPSLGQAQRPRPFITLSPPCPRLARGFYEQIKHESELTATEADLRSTRDQLTSVRGERDDLQAKLTTATSDLIGMQQKRDSLQAQLTDTSGKLTTTQQTHDALTGEVKAALPYQRVVDSYIDFVISAVNQDPLAFNSSIVSITAAVQLTANKPLTDVWQAWLDAPGGSVQERTAEGAFLDVLRQRLDETKPKVP